MKFGSSFFLFASLLILGHTGFAGEVKRISFGGQFACATKSDDGLVCWDNTTGEVVPTGDVKTQQVVHAVIYSSPVFPKYDSERDEIFCAPVSNSWQCWGKPDGYFESRVKANNSAWYSFLKHTPSNVRIGKVRRLELMPYRQSAILCAEDEFGVQCWSGGSDQSIQYADLSTQRFGTEEIKLLGLTGGTQNPDPDHLGIALQIRGQGIHYFEFGSPYFNNAQDAGRVGSFESFADKEIVDFEGTIDYLHVLTAQGVYFCSLEYHECKFLDTQGLMKDPKRLLHARQWLEGGYHGRLDACLQDSSGNTACSHEAVLELPKELSGVKINDRSDVGCFATDRGVACPIEINSIWDHTSWIKPRIPADLFYLTFRN